jgi:hypothetical protein
MEGLMYGYIGRNNESMDGCMNEWIDGLIDGCMVVGINGWKVSISETIHAWAGLD